MRSRIILYQKILGNFSKFKEEYEKLRSIQGDHHFNDGIPWTYNEFMSLVDQIDKSIYSIWINVKIKSVYQRTVVSDLLRVVVNAYYWYKAYKGNETTPPLKTWLEIAIEEISLKKKKKNEFSCIMRKEVSGVWSFLLKYHITQIICESFGGIHHSFYWVILTIKSSEKVDFLSMKDLGCGLFFLHKRQLVTVSKEEKKRGHISFSLRKKWNFMEFSKKVVSSNEIFCVLIDTVFPKAAQVKKL